MESRGKRGTRNIHISRYIYILVESRGSKGLGVSIYPGIYILVESRGGEGLGVSIYPGIYIY